MILVSNNQFPVILEPSKKSFDFPSAFIPTKLSSVLSRRFLSISFMWCNKLYTAFRKKPLIQRITVICLITNQSFRSGFSKTAVNSLFNKSYFVWGSTSHISGDRNTRSVCNCHDLGAFPAFCIANSKPPFFAGAKLPSMNASLISIFPGSYKSSTSSWTICLKATLFDPILESPVACLVWRVP